MEVRQVASLGRRRGRLGDVAGRENGEGSSNGQRIAVEELREGSSLHTVPCAAQGEA